MKALIIIDVQNDFCPGGALPVPEGDRIVPVINEIMDKFDIVIASKDWHRKETEHFKRWPIHCLEESKGADFHPDLRADRIREVFLKGTGLEDKGYSVFEATNLNLEDYLKNRNISEIYLTGLALDYCVKETARDAIKKGFKTYIVLDATKGLSKESEERAIKELQSLGVIFINSKEL